MTTAFEGVAHQHRRNGKETEVRKGIYAGDLSGQKVRSASEYDRCKTV